MTITIPPELEAALQDQAVRQGTTPEKLALSALREKLKTLPAPRDDWERLVLSIGIDCGTSLSDEAVSSEGLYE